MNSKCDAGLYVNDIDDSSHENELDEKFGSCISNSVLQLLDLDFSPDNIQERKRAYRDILEHFIRADQLKNSFIAGGGYFIKYTEKSRLQLNDQFDQKRLESLKQNSTMQIYVQYGDEATNHRACDLLAYLVAKPQPDSVCFPNRAPSVLDVQVQINGTINAVIKFVPCGYGKILNSFTFEPCKICYHYESDKILLSPWFLTGGEPGVSKFRHDVHHNELVEKYKYKNIFEDSLPPIQTDTFFNLNFDAPQVTDKGCRCSKKRGIFCTSRLCGCKQHQSKCSVKCACSGTCSNAN